MLNYKRNLVLDLFDYSGNKLCTLYDSTSDISGQAANVIKKTERNGWKQLSFTIPSKCEDASGKQVDNYRLDFLKADYKIRAMEGEPDKRYVDWYLIQEPKITHKNFSKDVSVTADHVARLLKTKNLGLEFSDKEGNNVGTAEELLATILDGTGWQPGSVAKFYEKYDAEKEKVRSLKAASKTGAFKMISSMCDLFEAKPIYNGDTKTVDIVPMNPFSKPVDGELPEITDGHAIELHYGKNLKNISRTLDTENMVTKLYCYGAYGDKTSGYCGIDEWHHLEYKFSAELTAGQEYRIAERDELAGIEYIRYFTAKHSGKYTLIWSMLDPASMRYVWNEEEGKAYRVYETPQQPSATTLENPTKETVINQVSYLMDFDYYDAVGLMSDEMLQTIAEYQRGMPALLKASTEAAARFNTSLDTLSETIGSVNFCKLAVTSYEDEAGYLKLNLNTAEYANKGIIYRTDYTTKERDQFKWRVAKKLKDNGDPVHDVASILYIIHKGYNPVRFDMVYLRGINGRTGDAVTEDDIDHPTTISLWTNYEAFDKANLDQDEIFLFQANMINGYLGALEASDEAAVTALEKATEQSETETTTQKNPVYFVRKENGAYVFPSIDGFTSYAWTWFYDEKVEGSENDLYFCFKSENDEQWQKVYFTENGTNVTGMTSGNYCYAWRESMLYRYTDGTWAPLNETTQQSRAVSAFGTVWRSCQNRDRLYKGYWSYYTKEITAADLNKFGTGTEIPPGNYAIKETDKQWTIYHAFSTEDAMGGSFSGSQFNGDMITYDSTNGWVTVVSHNSEKKYPDMDIEDIISKTLKCKDFRFDNVFSLGGNLMTGATWSEGNIERKGNLKPHSKIIYEGGGEIDNEGTNTFKRTGFIGVYPNISYGILSTSMQAAGSLTIVHFYTMEHSYLGEYVTGTLTDTAEYFDTPANARFIRVVSNDTMPSNIKISGKNNDAAFVTDERTYYILGAAEPDESEKNKCKGIVPLMDVFYKTANQAYEEDLAALKKAQADVKKKEDEVVTVLGDVYREGYWQKADYVDGDEDKLYYDGLENLRKIAQPESKYDIQYLDLYDANTAQFNYAVDETANVIYWPDLEADWGVHIVDPEIGISQWGFIDTLQKCYDQPWKTTISVNTNLSTIAQHSFTDVMTHIAEVAKQTNAKMEMYDRADAFSSNGSMPASNLEGVIDANKLILTGGSSTWYTDQNGNMIFESGDGKSAMTLTGNGFCIADSKNESGEWDWRTKNHWFSLW